MTTGYLRMRKRLIALLLCLCALCTAFTAAASETDGLAGDANGDGAVTASDAALVMRFVVGLDDGVMLREQLQADINCNGELDASDASEILRYVAGLSPLTIVSTDATTMDLLNVRSTLGEDRTEWAARRMHAMPWSKRKSVIYTAARYLGTPYGTDDGQLDCSAYLRTAFQNAGIPESVYPHTNSNGTLVWFRSYHPDRLHETDPDSWRDWKPGCVLIYINPANKRGSHVALYVCEVDGKPIVMESRREECDGVRIGVLMDDEDKCVLTYYADPFQ